MFSVVGLLPAAVSSFDIKNFVEGGKKFLKYIEKENNFDLFFVIISNDIITKKRY